MCFAQEKLLKMKKDIPYLVRTKFNNGIKYIENIKENCNKEIHSICIKSD